ncbi:MAG: regulatory protein GemA [Deltaproteobacteria bacterium]|nr:regulatory protein GemA [Deltaproteobacteria bacterium]
MSRKSLLAKVHIGIKALGWEEDMYRQILQGRYGEASASLLTDGQLAEFVAYLGKQGVRFKAAPGRKAQRRPAPGRAAKDYYEIPDGPNAAQLRYIAGLWNKLGYAMGGLDARVKKQFGVEKFIWLRDQEHLQTLAKDLVVRCRKAGMDPKPW